MVGLPLVTGASGFAGSHLVEHLLEREPAVAAWSNPRGNAPSLDDSRIAWGAVDILDRSAVRAAIDRLKPSVVYHCAGAADVGGSWKDPVTPLRVNALGTHHLLDALQSVQSTARVLVVGSAAVYRISSETLAEDAPLAPASPYGVTKLAQEVIARGATSLPIVLVRPFNHVGPRQSPAFVMSSFARQIAEIEAGATDPVLRVGNLDAQRDITDVRDVVRAYKLLAEKGRLHQPYNVCSGRAYRIGDLLEMLLARAQRSIKTVIDPSRLRPSDQPLIVGDPARARTDCGWQATIPIETTLNDLLDYWRQRIALART